MGALIGRAAGVAAGHDRPRAFMGPGGLRVGGDLRKRLVHVRTLSVAGPLALGALPCRPRPRRSLPGPFRSEEHTSELQSLMRISYAVFCLKKKIKKHA